MSNELPFSGIVPMIQYRYDMRKASRPFDQMGSITAISAVWWHNVARSLTANVLYGIAQYTKPNGVVCTVEAGVLLFPMYDFCGGYHVSSAFVVARSPVPSQYSYFKTGLIGMGETPGSGNLPWSAFPQYSDVIPCLSAYTGRATHTHTEAESIMAASLASGIVSASFSARRVGLMAADRLRTCATRPIMQLLDNPAIPHYIQLPAVLAWPNSDEMTTGLVLRDESWDGLSIAHARGLWNDGRPYVNRNSGSMVAMCTVHLEESVGASPRYHRVVEAECAKFANPRLYDLCPHGLFHN